jgi:hypothetical protein
MAINFDSFTEGTTSNIQSNDYVVGFDTAVPGGERKFRVSTLANAVSGIITPSLYQTWTTATRPASPTLGKIGYNTTLQIVEYYNGTQWMTCEATRRSDQVIQAFTSSTTFTVPAGITNISEVLVVAGGGGGGSSYGAGGGAGGVLYATNILVTPGALITVTVGAGGTGGRGQGNGSPFAASNGGNSVFGSFTAIGGGYGGQYINSGSTSAGSGGSGGGGYVGSGGPGTLGQGYAGGNGSANGAGGGGAGEQGYPALSNIIGANGGDGIPNPISGSTAGQLVGGVYYFSGGGASAGSSTNGIGGVGGGASGVTAGDGISGTPNTGGGGGGSYNWNGSAYAAVKGGDGGSGIVIIKY